jgi:apolipoprotein D and lipocalin family protein
MKSPIIRSVSRRDAPAPRPTIPLREDGDIEVLNTCHLDSLNGKLKTATGRARLVDTVSKAKLEVSFFRPFWGDYWVIDLADDYSYAVVGHPGRDYLWILSRTPTMTPEIYAGILGRLSEQKYDTSRIIKTVQPPSAPTSTAVDSP